MAVNRTGNYCAFYVAEPFSESNLNANATHDFVYYNTLRMWKGKDLRFPFIDSHSKTYSVRDGSTWETLKARLRARLDVSKNIILFLSSKTANSRAVNEEIEYGINSGLPIIIVYPDYNEKAQLLDSTGTTFNQSIQSLWNKLPTLKDNMDKVPTIHIPMNKNLIAQSLNDIRFTINGKGSTRGRYFYKV
nr:TIR domain-containing protein [Moraxella sp. CTOTU47724]